LRRIGDQYLATGRARGFDTRQASALGLLEMMRWSADVGRAPFGEYEVARAFGRETCFVLIALLRLAAVTQDRAPLAAVAQPGPAEA